MCRRDLPRLPVVLLSVLKVGESTVPVASLLYPEHTQRAQLQRHLLSPQSERTELRIYCFLRMRVCLSVCAAYMYRSIRPVWELNANSSKTVKATDFKFDNDTHAYTDSPKISSIVSLLKAYRGHALVGRLETCLRVPHARRKHRQSFHILINTMDQVLRRLTFVRHFAENLQMHIRQTGSQVGQKTPYYFRAMIT